MSQQAPTAPEPASFADLPIQRTGSGVQDLEIAYEQMELASGDAASADEALGQGVEGVSPGGDTVMPIEDEDAAIISAAHPS
ncbi:hypothetical protein [Sphingomonas sp. Leaf257]|uniref:hypothetical protein n=1 Tax=Sphingomonas sp. Leaf257 TaxID=1736309 RepID=UPI000AC15B86|nr:hypothetical protein [Sphingomonas sp. Leaf257]